MEGKGTCKDLLELEHKDLSSSSSAIESALLVCKEKKKKKREEAPPSKPTIAPLPKSQFLDKVKGFLGIMAEANKKLEQEAEGNSEAFDIEALTGNESQVIEMDLMVGVADLNTPEAVNAAEAAIAGNGRVAAESEDSSSSDESDSEDEEEEKKSSLSGESSRKRPKIIELS